MTEPFFSRWSKRKQAVAKGLPADELAPSVDPAPAQAAAGAAPEAAPPEDKPADALPTLQDVKDLTPSSDFQPFMRQGVAPEVRNAAVKKLFTDPHFNVMDGLDIYIGDYNTPDPLPAGMLQKMVGAQLLNLFPESTPSPEEARETATRALPPAFAQENPEQSPDAAEGSPLVAQSPPPLTTSALQDTPALQAPESTEHDHPDLQLQPNHAPASPSSGPSTG